MRSRQDDDKIIATAILDRDDYLVSKDKDLLDLKEYKGIKIVNTEEFLKMLK